MRKNALWLGMILIMMLLNGCGGASTKAPPPVVNPSHPSLVTIQQLNAVLSSGKGGKAAARGRIISGVVPHHLVAGGLLTDFFGRIVPQKPDLVILVGPNHPNKGSKVITSLYDWQTPEGLVKSDQKIVQVLIDKGLAVRNEKIMAKEHSVGALMPLIKHFLPEARVVPIILHHNVSIEEVDALIAELDPYLDEDAVLISSVDFSHYLTRQEAEAKDKETLYYMQKFDFNNLFRLGNDNLDSPAALAGAFRLAERRGVHGFTVLGNTNSGIIMGNDTMETTSYFELGFGERQSDQ